MTIKAKLCATIDYRGASVHSLVCIPTAGGDCGCTHVLELEAQQRHVHHLRRVVTRPFAVAAVLVLELALGPAPAVGSLISRQVHIRKMPVKTVAKTDGSLWQRRWTHLGAQLRHHAHNGMLGGGEREGGDRKPPHTQGGETESVKTISLTVRPRQHAHQLSLEAHHLLQAQVVVRPSATARSEVDATQAALEHRHL